MLRCQLTLKDGVPIVAAPEKQNEDHAPVEGTANKAQPEQWRA